MRWLSKLGTTTPHTRVPAWSLLVSLLSFCWLPLLHAKYGYTVQQVSIRHDPTCPSEPLTTIAPGYHGPNRRRRLPPRLGFPMLGFHPLSHLVGFHPHPNRKINPQLNTIYRTNIHHENLTGDHIRYNRAARTKDAAHFSSLLTYFQPAVAWIGLLGCLSIVLLFSSANMWNGTITVEKVAAAYVEVSRLPPPPRLHNAKSS